MVGKKRRGRDPGLTVKVENGIKSTTNYLFCFPGCEASMSVDIDRHTGRTKQTHQVNEPPVGDRETRRPATIVVCGLEEVIQSKRGCDGSLLQSTTDDDSRSMRDKSIDFY
ncbi:acyl-CoA thioesterase II TesB1 [Anopheles sinensis]|uniref:Acyl-CoA thioesterase II TesB1 n=1 Tax=Anopheles sinensis TaxID=74873 RepID=A0A084VY44_ANOSI|nr:acyl-CoA thioesterase II TesB1 [Anopheles sinensis]